LFWGAKHHDYSELRYKPTWEPPVEAMDLFFEAHKISGWWFQIYFSNVHPENWGR